MRAKWIGGFVAVVVVGAAAWAVYATGAWGRVFSPRRPNVLLISIDTLRADRLGAYGYARASTPHIDALAARGARFTQATTVAPLTLPAHASLLTGTFPTWHGIRDNGGFYLADDQVTLAEVLSANGYRTGGFVGAFVLDSRWGIAQGFDRYFDDFDLSRYDTTVGLDAVQRPAREVIDQTIRWIDGQDDRPFFAWVHLYDPHAPYEAPEPFRSSFARDLYGSYDAEVAATDAGVGRLLQHLASRGRLDDTIAVLVADHGEALGEHGEQAHGFFVYDGTAAIPLIFAGPGVGARTIPDQVRIVDVMPTILALLDLDAPREIQGASLLPALRGERVDLLAFVETWYPRYHYGWSELMAVRDGRYKFIAAPHRELYDTQADPAETLNMADDAPSRADALERALSNMVAGTTSRNRPRAPAPVEPEVEERLRALGYVGGGTTPRALEERKRGDPKDKIGLYNLLKQAALDSVDGRIDAAVEKVRQALAADPEIVEGHTMLGNLYVKARRLADAADAYQRALALDPEHQGATFSLALAYKQMGRLEDAREGFERARRLDPNSGRTLWQLADIAMQQREFSAAESILREGLSKEVDGPAFRVKLGECYVELRRYDEAERLLRQALSERPAIPIAHYDLALIHEARRELDRAMSEYRAELSRSPTHWQSNFNLGKLLARAGRHAEAATHFRKVAESRPEFAAAHLYLAKTLLDEGDLGGAESAANRGLAARPERAVAPLGYYVLADVYNRLGRARDAARAAAMGKRLGRGG